LPFEFRLLPDWPIAFGEVGWFALLLLLAGVLGEVSSRVMRLPRIAGYLLAGVLLGPYGAAVIRLDAGGVRNIIDVVLGLVLFELGHRLDMGWLRRNPWLLAASLIEAGLAGAAGFGMLIWLGFDPTQAATAALIGIATSPAVAVRVTGELRAQGQVTERLLTLTALNNIYAVVAVTGWLAWTQFERQGAAEALLQPVYLVCGSFLLAAAGALAVRYLLNVAGRSGEVGFLMFTGILMLLITLAISTRLSVLLTLLAFGTLAKYLDPRLRVLPAHFNALAYLLVVVLFAVSGAGLEFDAFQAMVLPALGFAVARMLGKTAGVLATAVPSGIDWRKGALLGAALTPMSGLVALALMQSGAALGALPGGGSGAVVLAALVVLEFLGPIAAHFALIAAREANPPARG
jgi:Kef-type K+ transport system membrane component KefB